MFFARNETISNPCHWHAFRRFLVDRRSGTWLEKPKRLLLRTRDYCVRPWAAFVGRRRDGCKLAAQKAWRGTMVHGRPDSIDNPDASARLERRSEVIEQAVRLCDFVIHVH